MEQWVELNDRLRRLGVLRGVGHLRPRATPPPCARRRGIEQLVQGQVMQNDRGAFFLADETFPLDHRHGGEPLASFLDHAPETLAQLTGDESLAHLDLHRTAFIDTETTGLAGGTGTYAFLIGIGCFDGDCFRLRQYFMRDFGEEQAMLHHLAGHLDELQGLISFNGKSFDVPLLETRFLLARLRPNLLAAPHLDLLFPCRCLWRARLCSCALSSLEHGVLGFQRDGRDVPGWQIPAMYFAYLQTGDAHEIQRVFYHNAQDILSMVSLTTRACTLFHSPTSGPPADGLDLLSVGRLCERLGLVDRSERAYLQALHSPISPQARAVVMEQLAFLYKRSGRWLEAVELWESLCTTRHSGLMPHIELAKYYEHHVMDFDRAIALVLQARELLLSQPRAMPPGVTLAELDHRLDRLRRKLERGQRAH
jgi:hypothetical protein